MKQYITHAHRGFSIPEVVLVMAILAIMISVAFPYFTNYFEQKQFYDERTAQQEIKKALEAFGKDQMTLPNPNSVANRTQANRNFHEELQPYINLSLYQMFTDVWERERVIVRYQEPMQFRGLTYDANYIAIISLGRDGCFGTGNGCAAAPTSFDTLEAFQDFEADKDSDDVITKVSDAKIKEAAYIETLRRMDKVKNALEEYASNAANRARTSITEHCQNNVTPNGARYASIFNCYELVQAGSVSYASSLADNQVFVPPSGIVANDPDTNYDVRINGQRQVLNETQSALSDLGISASRISTSTNNMTRRNSMIALMRVLGLPDSYCCSALERFETGGVWLDAPFFYYANPRPNNGGTCLVRGGVGTRKLPPMLSLVEQTCGN